MIFSIFYDRLLKNSASWLTKKSFWYWIIFAIYSARFFIADVDVFNHGILMLTWLTKVNIEIFPTMLENNNFASCTTNVPHVHWLSNELFFVLLQVSKAFKTVMSSTNWLALQLVETIALIYRSLSLLAISKLFPYEVLWLFPLYRSNDRSPNNKNIESHQKFKTIQYEIELIGLLEWSQVMSYFTGIGSYFWCNICWVQNCKAHCGHRDCLCISHGAPTIDRSLFLNINKIVEESIFCYFKTTWQK